MLRLRSVAVLDKGMSMDTNLLIAPLFTLVGAIVGGAIGYRIEKQRQAHEERIRQVNDVKSAYRQVAFLLLKRFNKAENEKIDDVFLQCLVDIMLCDDKLDPINKSMIVLTNDSWNEIQKYNIVINKIIPEMRTRLKELDEARAKSWWRF
jgi:hypothetical protein